MSQEELSPLFEKLIVGKMTLAEMERLSKLLHDSDNAKNAESLIAAHLELSDTVSIPVAELQVPFETMLAQAIAKEKGDGAAPLKNLNNNRLIKWYRYAAAAAIIIVVTSIGYFLLNQAHNKSNDANPTTNIAQHNNAGPALQLADGSWVYLDSLQDGFVSNQSGTNVSLKNGQLAYQEEIVKEVALNEVRIPAGRQFRLVLSDGTKVWLNAMSSIQYPTAFNGNERRVKITGEVYFEVEKDAAKAFRVESKGQAVEVLGTHFNVDAYAEEKVVRTTLLEGSVRIIPARMDGESGPGAGDIVNNENLIQASIASSWIKPILLQPGEQAQLQDGALRSAKVSTEEAMAWRRGKFEFNNEDIHSIMRKLARWYDIDVVYKGDFKGKTFTGSITMNSTLTAILDKISYSKNVGFRLDGRVVSVLEGGNN